LHDHVQKDHVSVFGLLHVAHGGEDGGTLTTRESSSIETAQADRMSAMAILIVRRCW